MNTSFENSNTKQNTSIHGHELVLWRAAYAVTLADNVSWGGIEQAALVTQGHQLHWVGALSALPAEMRRRIHCEHDLGPGCITPGLVDCHTHLIYGGDRAGEFEKRLQGVSYEAIARAGGGIRSTVQATRQASDHQLYEAAKRRALSVIKNGVTTLEIKSGYGLDAYHEERCLRIARQLQNELPLHIFTTYLAAHTLPIEYEGQSDQYIDSVISWLPDLNKEGLVDAVDVFCDRIGFTREQTRRVFEAARTLNLPVKLHAEQLSNQEGAALAAEFEALSCDHLEHLSESGLRAMAAAGTVAVLLPGAYYFLRETHLPPIQQLREHRIPMAIATDHNPGSSPALSLPLMLHLACTLFRLTPEEALRGVTHHAAQALGLTDRGRLIPGQRADFVLWDLEHPRELAYWFGHNACRRVIRGAQEWSVKGGAQ